MVEVVVVYWRDIPAQVIIGKGRKAKKKQLSERFEKAIDRCAMKAGATGTDSYLRDWRKIRIEGGDGNADEILKKITATLEDELNNDVLKSLIDTSGWKS